jgi:ATP-dependent helicase/nuclease subunit A
VGEEAGAQVQILTVHKAKGLEFPIVVLADLFYRPTKPPKAVLRHAQSRGWLKIGPFDPEGWTEATEGEKRQSQAEERRLLYVALTRARDHLVIPCLSGEITDGWMRPILQGVVQPRTAAPFGAAASSLTAGGTKRGAAEVTYVDSPALTLAIESAHRQPASTPVEGGEDDARNAREAERLWQAGRVAALRTSPTPSGDDDDGPSLDTLDDGKAAAFGSLVHALLALPDAPTGETLTRAAQTLAHRSGLDDADADEATALVERVRTLPALADLDTADAVYREVPFVHRANGETHDGRIDLAYRRDGSWTVVDFKTARLATATEATARYAPQLRRYRKALAALTGEHVTASLCLVRTGELVAVE